MSKEIFAKSEKFKSEYSCAVVKIENLTPVEGSDFLAKTNVFGTQIVVRKDQVKEGDIMIYSANETQLNEKFLSVNNLFEIGCRDMNANADEVNAIMRPYLDTKPEIEKLKGDAKNVKNTIDNATKKSNKLNKEIKKLKKELESVDPDSEEYATLTEQIKEKQDRADACYKKALEKTTVYSNLKAEIEKLVKAGEPIVNEAKKLCGFFNKYGRVRCVTLKGEPSFGFLFALPELQRYCDVVTEDDMLAYVGNEFDTVNGELFVKAYVPPVKPENVRSNKNKAQKKIDKFDRMVEGEFFYHYNTSQFEKCAKLMQPSDSVAITVKEHGTSGIFAKLLVKEPLKLPFLKRCFNKFVDVTGLFKSLRITDYTVDYGPIYSSRTVIKNRYINNEVSGGYYNADVWTEWGDIVYPYLDKGMTIYGEIVGYITGTDKPIQKFYDYGCDKGENKLMVYRITTTNTDGSKFEWNVEEVRQWTERLIKLMKRDENPNASRIQPIVILYDGTLENLYPELDTENHWHEELVSKLMKDKEHFGMEENEPLCTFNTVPREGVCIRINNDKILQCFKAKTIAFKLKEAVAVDSGEVDIEMAEGYTEDESV